MRSTVWLNTISILLIVFCAYLLTSWHPTDPNVNKNSNQESAFFSHIHFQQFNEKGEMDNQFKAEQLSLLDNKEAYFLKPTFSLITTDHTPWTITSKTGKGYNNGEKVQLQGSVHIVQSATANDPQTEIFTTTLTLFPKKSQAETDQYILIKRPGMQISGKGMHADLKKNQFTLKKQTNGFYSPDNQDKAYQFRSDSLHYNGKNRTATYVKNVHIQKSNAKIEGDQVIVHTDQNNKVQSLTAMGSPAHYREIEKNKSHPLNATAQSIYFDTNKNIAILRKKAKVQQGQDDLQGDYVWYDAKTGLAKTQSMARQNKTIIHLEPQTK